MRPVGEIHAALLAAARDLATPGQAPTVAELALHAQVGLRAATDTVKNMRRHGALRIVRTRRVNYRNRPVAEYAPADGGEVGSHQGVDLGQALAAWMSQSY